MGSKAKKDASYQDPLALPDHLVGELISGELITSPRPKICRVQAMVDFGDDRLWMRPRFILGKMFWYQILWDGFKQKMILVMGWLLLAQSASWADRSPPTYFYGSASTSLIGEVRTVTFPGPPNFESIQGGDEPEPGSILFLDQAISVIRKKGDREYFHDTEREVRQIELVIHDKNRSQLIENKKVKVTGTFFSAHTGHHHTVVLMEVEKIEVIK